MNTVAPSKDRYQLPDMAVSALSTPMTHARKVAGNRGNMLVLYGHVRYLVPDVSAGAMAGVGSTELA